MLFNSIDFIFFFPLVVVAYFAMPPRFRWVLLLLASYYFYACWKVEYLLLIWASTAVDYWAALKMSERESLAERRPFLIGSLVVNLGLLGVFKYFNFFSASVQETLAHFNVFVDTPYLDVLLPVGISFYTFQTLSYSIDVYRGETEPERHLGYFALYVTYFPQLVAGPIERADRLIPQLRSPKPFDHDDVSWGLCKMAYGFFKKLVVADRLALIVNPVYSNPDYATTWTATLASIFFAFQIYCDFSGYSDIAIGAARVMGVRLSENFRRPYLSRTMAEFWSRWHITLFQWFRDYLYRSVVRAGGRRRSGWRRMLGVAVVFGAFGLWHGANWTYVVCGYLGGAYLVTGEVTAATRRRLWGWAEGLAVTPISAGCVAVMRGVTSRLIVFGLTVTLFVFFRSSSISDALIMFKLIGAMHFDAAILRHDITLVAVAAGKAYHELMMSTVIGVLAIILLLLSYALPADLRIRHRVPFLVAATVIVLLIGTDATDQFIYFQF